jgi:vacuolar-type H+-ATPase subunit H
MPTASSRWHGRTADQQVHDAHLEADSLLLDARQQSQRITEEARSRAYDIAKDSRRRDDDAKTDLHHRRAALARETDELAEFAENYRTALKDHVRRLAQS